MPFFSYRHICPMQAKFGLFSGYLEVPNLPEVIKCEMAACCFWDQHTFHKPRIEYLLHTQTQKRKMPEAMLTIEVAVHGYPLSRANGRLHK